MGILTPITADRAALAFNQWCTIHASVAAPLDVARAQAPGPVAVRTVCGSDVFPYIVAAGTTLPPQPMLLAWPPPPAQRCVDCERLLGTPRRRSRNGWGSWDLLREAS